MILLLSQNMKSYPKVSELTARPRMAHTTAFCH